MNTPNLLQDFINASTLTEWEAMYLLKYNEIISDHYDFAYDVSMVDCAKAVAYLREYYPPTFRH